MQTSGFTHAPLTRFLVSYTILSALLVSLSDTRASLPIHVDLHIWTYHQLWRFLTWPAAYISSVEVLSAVWILYNLRVVERAWGTRKFATFLFVTTPYTTLLPPLLLTLVLRPLSFRLLNVLSPGPTALVFALLAQYHAIIPHTYRYRLLTTRSPSPATQPALTLTSKSLSYVFPVHLALAALPGSLLSAAVGFAVGYAYRNEVLPGVGSAWRVPAWVVGEQKRVERERFERLRRRLEAEQEGRGSGRDNAEDAGGEARRRTLGGLMAEQFRGS